MLRFNGPTYIAGKLLTDIFANQMENQKRNYIYFGIIVLFLVGAFVFANSNLSSKNKNNTASIWSSVISFLGFGDNSVSGCGEGDISLSCPTDASAGCFCEGGILGTTNVVWEYLTQNQELSYSNASSYCSGLGQGWKLPSFVDIASTYSNDLELIYSTTSSIVANEWFKPIGTMFWIDYIPQNNIDRIAVLVKYDSTLLFNEQNLVSTVCVKEKSPNHTHIISTCQELQNINKDLFGDYTLANDIDCSDTQNWNNGEGFKPIGNESRIESGSEFIIEANPFSGSFDGKGYAISNLYINRPTEDGVGLFGYSTGNISNVNLTGINVSGRNAVGGLIGHQGGSVHYSSSAGNVNGFDTVGGLVGYNSGGSISNSYSMGDVKVLQDTAGGLAGSNYGSISNSYSTGNISGTYPYTTGLVGYNDGTISNSFWDTTTSNKTAMCGFAGGVGCDDTKGKTTDEMKKLYTFDSNGGNWDISGGQADNNNGYPYLSGTNPVWYISDNSAPYPPPTVSLEVSKTIINEKETVVITWTPTGATTCTATGDPSWAGSLNATDGSHSWTTGPLSVDNSTTIKKYTYNISCSNGSKNTDIVSKTVKAVPNGFPVTQVSTCQQLQNVNSDISVKYALSNNIDCTDTKNWNSGAGFKPIGSFSGLFDGNGHTISNLYINRPSEENVGLFGVVSNEATLTNFRLENISVAGGSKTGGLVGYNEGLISKIYVGGKVDGFGAYQTGGVIGAASMFKQYPGSEISQVYANVTVKGNAEVGCFIGYLGGQGVVDSYCEGEVIGGKNIDSNTGWTASGFAGVLIGANSMLDTQQAYGYLKNVYSNVKTSIATPEARWSGEDAAGLSGRTFGRIDNSFSVSTFSCTSCNYPSNGISGYEYKSANGGFGNDFYYSVNNVPSLCVREQGNICTKITDLNYFKNKNNEPLASWNFTNVWGIDPSKNNGYPYLRWADITTIPTGSCPFNNVLTSSNGCTSCNVDNDYLITSCGDKPTSNPCNTCSSPDRHLSVGAGCWYCVRTCGSLTGTEGMVLNTSTNECECPVGKIFDGYGTCKSIITKNTEAKITSLTTVINTANNANIDDTLNKIKIGLEVGTNVSSITTNITVSEKASVSVSSGSVVNNGGNSYTISGQNLSTPKTYTITSEDGLTNKVYTVSVAYPPSVSLGVSKSIVYENQTSIITWNPLGATNCFATSGSALWPGTRDATDGPHSWTTGLLPVDSSTAIKTYTYSIVCSNSEGSTNIVSKDVKVKPDIYPAAPNQSPTPGGSGRMSTALSTAGVTLGANEIPYLIYRDSYYNYKNNSPVAYITTCPVGSGYRVCVQDYDDGASNHILIGVK